MGNGKLLENLISTLDCRITLNQVGAEQKHERCFYKVTDLGLLSPDQSLWQRDESMALFWPHNHHTTRDFKRTLGEHVFCQGPHINLETRICLQVVYESPLRTHVGVREAA